jgi:hypothetical protein
MCDEHSTHAYWLHVGVTLQQRILLLGLQQTRIS